MRRHSRFDSLMSLEALDLRLSPSPLSLGGVVAASSINHIIILPENDSGDDPPITQPELPPTGPVGPGSSS
jgi:hypothetical protein